MRFLKKFNESAFGEDNRLENLKELQKKINTSGFTPVSDEVPLNSIYRAIIIKTQSPINTDGITSQVRGVRRIFRFPDENKVFDTRWVLLLFKISEFDIYFYPDESSLDNYLKSVLFGLYIDWRNKSIIGYNDINHLEIENMLSEFGIDVDEMWCIPRNRP